eukprot:1197209-Alexandrium_andersonii.AAC.1
MVREIAKIILGGVALPELFGEALLDFAADPPSGAYPDVVELPEAVQVEGPVSSKLPHVVAQPLEADGEPPPVARRALRR